jgi:hypothetical protein
MKLYQTEQSHRHQFGAAGGAAVAPEGPGTPGHNPLMRNLSAPHLAPRDGNAAPNTLALAGTLRVVCSWCHAEMGTRACEAAMDGLISHSLCPQCLPMYEASLEMPQLSERIAKADAVELAQIGLLEIAQIPDESLLLGLRRLIAKRFKELKATR